MKRTILTILALFMFVSVCLSAEKTLTWNTEPTATAGYSVFIRLGLDEYDYNDPAWVGTETSCTLEGLEDGVTYFMTIRGYNDCGNRSEDAPEIVVNTSCPVVFTPNGFEELEDQ